MLPTQSYGLNIGFTANNRKLNLQGAGAVSKAAGPRKRLGIGTSSFRHFARVHGIEDSSVSKAEGRESAVRVQLPPRAPNLCGGAEGPAGGEWGKAHAQ